MKEITLSRCIGFGRNRAKELFQQAKSFGPPQCTVVSGGCQRTGTIRLGDIFHPDFRSINFGEVSDLSYNPRRTVWKPLGEVRAILASQKAEYVVVKPLVHSHEI